MKYNEDISNRDILNFIRIFESLEYRKNSKWIRYFGNEVKFKNNIDTLKHHFIPQQYLKKFNALALEKSIKVFISRTYMHDVWSMRRNSDQKKDYLRECVLKICEKIIYSCNFYLSREKREKVRKQMFTVSSKTKLTCRWSVMGWGCGGRCILPPCSSG